MSITGEKKIKTKPKHFALLTENWLKSEHFAARILHIFFNRQFQFNQFTKRHVVLRDSRDAKLFSTDIFKGMSYSYC